MSDTVHVLTEDVTPFLDAAKFELAVSALPLTRAARIRQPRAEIDRARRLAAELSLRRLLRQVGEDYRALTVAYTETGKPYFEGRPDLAVSLSHSGFFAAVALTCAPGGIAPAVGVDIEAVPTGNAADKYTSLAKRFFSPGLLAQLLAAAPGDAPQVFARLWTLTEAATKAAGSGALDFKAAEDILAAARSRETRFLFDARGAEYALSCVTLEAAEHA